MTCRLQARCRIPRSAYTLIATGNKLQHASIQDCIEQYHALDCPDAIYPVPPRHEAMIVWLFCSSLSEFYGAFRSNLAFAAGNEKGNVSCRAVFGVTEPWVNKAHITPSMIISENTIAQILRGALPCLILLYALLMTILLAENGISTEVAALPIISSGIGGQLSLISLTPLTRPR